MALDQWVQEYTETHGLCCRLALSMVSGYIKVKEENDSVKLYLVDEFLAKNQIVETPWLIEIKSLSQYAPQDAPEQPVWPVHALDAYL